MLCSDAVKALKKELPKELTKAAFKRFQRAYAGSRRDDVRGEDVVILSAVWRETGKSRRSPALARLDRDVTRDYMCLDRAALAKSEP